MEDIKRKSTEIIEKHLDMLNQISVEEIQKNPALLIAVTESIKQLTGLLFIIEKL